MEFQQYLKLKVAFPEKGANIGFLRDFSPGLSRIMCNIYDQFGLSDIDYESCLYLITQALIRLKRKIEGIND